MRPSHSWMKSCCGNWVLGHQDHLQGRNCCGMSLNCFCCLSNPWTGEHSSWLGLRRVCHLLHWMWSSWSRHKGSFFTNSSLYFRLFQSLFHCIISDFSLVSTAWHCEQKATEEAYFDRQSVYSVVQWCTVVYSDVQWCTVVYSAVVVVAGQQVPNPRLPCSETSLVRCKSWGMSSTWDSASSHALPCQEIHFRHTSRRLPLPDSSHIFTFSWLNQKYFILYQCLLMNQK